ncbi:uncharacterized protein Z518_09989 [Rhinocladiella mackenziei CBS 650.93]|uniref:tRNA (guanine(9)-N1)-methyltransferase n=1 Tax=Rhinocladiella mackenziei CBS 650.93 TaxID=1442369 RepID=A0A0D2I539_9EURO|nr:uncharacterized protein Z518_09989 [Rhinocladiella mackenziei CBS 650.93]KIX00924.1 hypothetical protein Z518_09989 [Rhinocladiella mackenziei CBS 650.93]
MEAEERPTKFRKLDSKDDLGHEAVSDAPFLSNVKAPGSESSHTPPWRKSKPQEQPANVAEPLEEEIEDGNGPEAEGETEERPTAVEPHQQNGEPPKPMSKNQLKKLRKREEWEAGRGYRKAKRKQKAQEKKARKRAAREEEQQRQELLQKDDGGRGQNGDALTTAVPEIPPKLKYRRPVQVPVTIIIDCGFDDLMMEKERISLGSQITRSYSDNSHAPFQAHLVISSWGGLLKERFDTVLNKHYMNWKGVTFAEDDFIQAAEKATEVMNGPKGGKLAGFFEKYAGIEGEFCGAHGSKSPENADESGPVDFKSSLSNGELDGKMTPTPTTQEENQPPSTIASTQPVAHSGKVIYLTSDSPDTLTTLTPYSTYIVGGLVDKNRHKGICYKTARDRGIQTAKLPIGEYMDMQSRKVLATNHVVEIMIRWLECGDWGEALMQVIPKRKGGKLREDERGDEEDGNGVNDEDADG